MAQHILKKPKFKNWAGILLLILCAVFVYSAYRVISGVLTYRQGTDTYENLASLAVSMASPRPTVPPASAVSSTSAASSAASPSSAVSSAASQTPTPTPEPTPPPEAPASINFAVLQEINPDIVAWLFNYDSPISYPVVKGADNDFYLTHMADKTKNANGALFIDCRCAETYDNFNTVLYGHSMDNGSMFGSLLQYRRQWYYDTHSSMLYYTPTATYRVHIFSAYLVNADQTDVYAYWSFSEADKADYLQNVSARSLITPRSTPTVEDRILTFSTCAYDFKDARMLVHGYLEEIS